MLHQFSHCSFPDLRAWQLLFLAAIFSTALPTITSAPAQSSASATEALSAQTHGASSDLYTSGVEGYVDQPEASTYTANPHPPIYTATTSLTPALRNVPDLYFSTGLETVAFKHPYQILPVFDVSRSLAWDSKPPSADTVPLKATFSRNNRPSISSYLTLFQPEIEPEPKQWVVVIDAGHGGSDPGSQAHNGLVEKELTLDIAKRTRKYLSKQDNVKVVLTRDTDKGMSRGLRVHKVKSSNADIVVSLHFNHLPQSDLNIVETFYAGQKNIAESQAKQMVDKDTKPMQKIRTASRDYSFTRHSKRLAKIMQKNVFSAVRKNNSAVKDAGVKQDTLFILTRSFTPGVLIELSCISNPEEADKLATVAYRERMAKALALGIKDYMITNPEAKTTVDMEV